MSIRANDRAVPEFDSTCFKCFLIKIDPLSVHLVSLRFEFPSAYWGGAPFFSLTHISISAKRKHSSSCHDRRSLPTRIVPYRRSLPNLPSVLVTGVNRAYWVNSMPLEVQSMPVVHAYSQIFCDLVKKFLGFEWPIDMSTARW